MSLHANAIAQVEPPAIGIHLIWMGPRPWIYSLKGWFIQRRTHREQKELDCDGLDAEGIKQLRAIFERPLRFGTLTLRQGLWPTAVAPPSTTQPTACDVFTLELDNPQSFVRVEVQARSSFAFALREGKVVAVGGPPQPGAVAFDLQAIAIHTVVVYALVPGSLRFCVRVPIGDEEKEWANVPFIVKELQLPLQELMPGLASPDDEYAEGKARLLPGESLDEAEFKRLTNTLRAGVQQAGPPRPIDQVLLIREDPTADFEELVALDPIRVLLSHPRWRRVLGFGWFDNDPSLVVGETYEYRITGFFPAEDLADKVYGFHTIPSQTALPAEFYLQDLRLRLPQPTRIERAPDTLATGLIQISRRGLTLHPQDQLFWLWPSLEDWSLVIDFPSPVSSVILELHEDHTLEYVSGMAWETLSGPDPVPPGPRPRLDFPTPIQHLRLRGTGFLFAIRIPSGSERLVPLSVVLPPVTLVDSPRPEPPVLASISNLQQPQSVPTDDTPPAALPPRHNLGFEVKWRPALLNGLQVWPPDQQAAPPIEASLYQIEHREEPSTDWNAVLPEENWTLGDRDETAHDTQVHPGVDLMSLFPEIPRRAPGAGLDVYWKDVFDFKEGDNPVRRPVPPPGSNHQYRVRAVDPVGRPSLSWRTTNLLRLEKHLPPPVPVGPEETPADTLSLPAPTGVQARVLVRDAPDLTSGDQALLGTDDNLIILRWGWHQQQRDQDPFATEFRVYVADQPLDAVPGTLTAVTVLTPGLYNVTLNLSRAVIADAAKGSALQAGYPFYIRAHTAGSTVTATVEARVPGPNGTLPQPAPGPILLPLHLTPDLTRPPAWSARVEVQSITAATQYQAILRNRLTLTSAHPRDSIWVGVSAADDQSYVPDQLAPTETRPGNESAIVPVLCEARFHGRPVFDIPPALDPVPVLMAPEPSDRPIFFDLNLTPYLSGTGLTAGDSIRPERVSADAVFAAYYVTADNRIMARVVDRRDPSESESEVTVPNPGDRAAIIAALNNARTDVLEDRFVVFLAGSHPYRDRLFESATPDSVPLGAFRETLPPKGGRYVYRVRKSDAAGHLSAGGALAKVIVRVPSMAPGAAPERAPSEGDEAPGTLRLRIAPEPELTHVLVFSQVASPGSGPVGEADLLRVPNAVDLYPNRGIRFRAPDGTLLVPQVKALTDADFTLDDEGFRRVSLSFSAGAGERVRIWACTLTRDGIASLLGGPWSLAMPVAPLPAPSLTVSGTLPNLSFAWSWPAGPTYNVALELSSDGAKWQRVSPPLAETVTTFAYTQSTGIWQYRLRVMSPDGRSAFSNVVIP